ncbi:MAG: hypothetical protein LBU89_01095 [Fibromonadaceae bacterium]|jgi:hypothetical protein|nr:hypothetical protein [Fibromonadaceae bacterium]
MKKPTLNHLLFTALALVAAFGTLSCEGKSDVKLLERIINDDDTSVKLEYDEKMSPFRNVSSPKWLMQYLFRDEGLVNNVARHEFDYMRACTYLYKNYEYEYDAEGFPTQRTTNARVDLGGGSEMQRTITRFAYRGEIN